MAARSRSNRALLASVASRALCCGKRKLRANPFLTLTTSPMAPSFSTRSSRMTSMGMFLLLHDVRQQRQMACALDSLAEQALLLRRDRSDAGGHDLAFLGDVALEQLYVLVVQRRRVGAGERAYLAPAAERAARGQVGDVDLLLCHVGCSYRSPRSGRGPRGGRSPKSRGGRSPKPRSRPPPPKPPSSSRRLRSSRSLRATTGEGSSLSLSTFTVRKRRTSSLMRWRRSNSWIASPGA